MKVSRRNVLIAGGVAGLAPAFVAGRAVASTPADSIVRYIRATTGNTTIPEANLYQFARKFVAKYQPMFGRKFGLAMVMMDNPWSIHFLTNSRRLALEAFKRTLTTDFFFSTDFFTSAGRDLQRMSYIDFADQYALGCRNPLARFEMDA